jgi:hypothetical protein
MRSFHAGGLRSFSRGGGRSFAHSLSRGGNRSFAHSFSRGNRSAARSLSRGNRTASRSLSRANRVAGRNVGRNATRNALARNATRTALAHNAARAHIAGNALTSHRFANAGWRRNGAIGNRFLASRWAHAGWYHNWWRNRVVFGWWGPVFWPYAYYDVFASIFWPYAYWPYVYDPFWYYGYPDLYAGIFWPYGYDDFAVPPPIAYGGGGYASGAYAGAPGGPGYATGRAQRYASARASGNPPGGPTPDVRSTTQAAMGRYTEYCGDDSRDIAGVPVDDIQKALDPNDAQRAALDELGNASVQAAQIVKAACPKDVSLTPVGRMDAMQQRVQSMLDAVKVVRPPLENFYNMLSDEQKARFNALGQQNQSQQNQPRTAQAGIEVGSPAKNCTNRAIPDWPTAQIRTSVRPSQAQEASLDALQTAAAKAKDVLQASCPTDMPATPLARISAIEQRLQTILAAVQTVRGPLNDFYGSLSDEQKAQFNTIGRGTRPPKQG